MKKLVISLVVAVVCTAVFGQLNNETVVLNVVKRVYSASDFNSHLKAKSIDVNSRVSVVSPQKGVSTMTSFWSFTGYSMDERIAFKKEASLSKSLDHSYYEKMRMALHNNGKISNSEFASFAPGVYAILFTDCNKKKIVFIEVIKGKFSSSNSSSSKESKKDSEKKKKEQEERKALEKRYEELKKERFQRRSYEHLNTKTSSTNQESKGAPIANLIDDRPKIIEEKPIRLPGVFFIGLESPLYSKNQTLSDIEWNDEFYGAGLTLGGFPWRSPIGFAGSVGALSYKSKYSTINPPSPSQQGVITMSREGSGVYWCGQVLLRFHHRFFFGAGYGQEYFSFTQTTNDPIYFDGGVDNEGEIVEKLLRKDHTIRLSTQVLLGRYENWLIGGGVSLSKSDGLQDEVVPDMVPAELHDYVLQKQDSWNMGRLFITVGYRF